MTTRKARNVVALLLAAAAFSGCSSLPPYEGPSAANKASAASIDNSGDRFSCGPLSSYPRVCNATVNAIDGKKPGFFGSGVQVDPGPHRLQLLCFYQRDVSPGSKVGFFRLIDVVLAPNGKYKVQPREENNACRLALVDSATGAEVPSQEVTPAAGAGVQLQAPQR